jgi:CDP-glycerol glycerophosphotransferase (TagB/SpsB family)
MKFDAYITADLLWVKLPRGTRRIFTFHGVAGKYGNVYDSPDSSMRDWDRLFFINQRRMRNFVASGAIDPESDAARLVGYPKLDCLVDGTLKRDEALSSLGIDPRRQTVMYAPTWSQYSSLNKMGEELIERLCAAGYAVIVKLHDRSRDPAHIHSGGVDWVSRLEPVLARSAGHLATGSDASLYLAAADALITDHSSVGFEYLLLDRPLIRIEAPELIAATNIHSDYVSLMAEASTTVKTAEQAVSAVYRSLSEPMQKSVSRKAVADELFYRPGTATKRAVRELYEVLELDPIAELSAAEVIGSRAVES